MGKDHDERLQRYFDGELPPEERARFEAELTDEDRERLRALEEMRALVRGTLEHEAEGADLDIWGAIAPELATGATGPSDPRSAARAAGQVARPRRNRGGRLRRWLGPSAAGLVAAAAAALIVLFHPWHPSHPTNGCDIESLEVDGAEAAVIQVTDEPHKGDGETTIIWTTEDN